MICVHIYWPHGDRIISFYLSKLDWDQIREKVNNLGLSTTAVRVRVGDIDDILERAIVTAEVDKELTFDSEWR